jgi:hypothetical protein
VRGSTQEEASLLAEQGLHAIVVLEVVASKDSMR